MSQFYPLCQVENRETKVYKLIVEQTSHNKWKKKNRGSVKTMKENCLILLVYTYNVFNKQTNLPLKPLLESHSLAPYLEK